MLNGGFFNAQMIQGIYDREYSAEDFARCLSGFIGDGIVGKNKDVSNAFKVEKYTEGGEATKKIKINPGYAWVNGKWADNDSFIYEEIEMPTSPGYKRIDKVFLRCDYVQRKFSIVVRQGNPYDTLLPGPDDVPYPQNDEEAKELTLASLGIHENMLDNTNLIIIDEREFAHVIINSVDMTEYYNKTQINERLDNLSLLRIQKEDYDALEEKDQNTIYYVFDGTKVKQYLGDALLSSAGITAGTIIPMLRNNMAMIAGNITEV